MTATRTVAVTGASGFVGRAVLGAMAGAPDMIAQPISRGCGGPDLETSGEDEWRRALAGADACVHLAARLPWGGDNTARRAAVRFIETNVAGSCRVFRACRDTGVRHFVLLSTIGINGVTSGAAPFCESDPPRPVGNYAVSKCQAEARLAELAAERGVTLTVIRAPIVYGAGVGGPFRRLVTRIRRGRLLPLGGVDNRRDMLGVRNLADLLVAVLREGIGGTFPVCDRDPVSSPRLVEMIAEAYGTAPRLLAVPPALRAVAMHLPVGARLFGNVRIDDGALRRECSWAPRYTVADELRSMASADRR